MTLCQDRQMKGYCQFLVVLTLLTLGAVGCFCAVQTFWAADLYAGRNASIASALLAHGVDARTIADALTGTEISAEGTALLSALGLSADAPASIIPALSEFRAATLTFVWTAAAMLLLLLLAGTGWFLVRQNRLYVHATEIIQAYMNGDYTCHLPQNEEGALDQLFSAVEQLATMLAAKSEAEHRNKEFLKNTISDISHQLKTPLAALTMYQEIIGGEPENPDTVRGFAEKMGASLERMEQLIQAMLKITRLDAGNILFEKEEHLAAEVIACAINDLTVRAKREQKALCVEGDPGLSLCCDLEWTREAIGNVVKNALDHTGAGDEIRIAWEASPVGFRIMIQDTGRGIAPEELYHIFKRFYRGPHSAKTPGVGLGLPLAKAIIEGQGGRISVQSEPGQGTCFVISFLTES